MPQVRQLPSGLLGFDCDWSLSIDVAQRFARNGFSFVGRYLSRIYPRDTDLTEREVTRIHNAGLSVFGVQHVEPARWHPTKEKGLRYGTGAVRHAINVGLPTPTTLALDLEEVADDTTASETIAYCNAWFDVVTQAGYKPLLYVGYNCGLTASQLYYRLKVAAYWSSYNLDKDQYPAVRGVCLRQIEPTKKQPLTQSIPVGLPGWMKVDLNISQLDNLGACSVNVFAPDESIERTIERKTPTTK